METRRAKINVRCRFRSSIQAEWRWLKRKSSPCSSCRTKVCRVKGQMPSVEKEPQWGGLVTAPNPLLPVTSMRDVLKEQWGHPTAHGPGHLICPDQWTISWHACWFTNKEENHGDLKAGGDLTAKRAECSTGAVHSHIHEQGNPAYTEMSFAVPCYIALLLQQISFVYTPRYKWNFRH